MRTILLFVISMSLMGPVIAAPAADHIVSSIDGNIVTINKRMLPEVIRWELDYTAKMDSPDSVTVRPTLIVTKNIDSKIFYGDRKPVLIVSDLDVQKIEKPEAKIRPVTDKADYIFRIIPVRLMKRKGVWEGSIWQQLSDE